MSSDANCIFCKIVRGEMDAIKLYETAEILAFMDIMPQSPGHCLVIPKKHAPNLHEVSADDAATLIRATRHLAGAVNTALKPDGIGVYQFNGSAAGQTVFHIHFHIIPRRAGVDLAFHARSMADPAELQQIAQSIRAALG
ncbi:MAG: HIT family protein [Pseudomonadota bacterium]